MKKKAKEDFELKPSTISATHLERVKNPMRKSSMDFGEGNWNKAFTLRKREKKFCISDF